jgi:hypothetical protein
VRKVLQANSIAVPKIEREEKAAPYHQQILELLQICKGNLVRVHGAKAMRSCWPMAPRCRIKR